jgi:ribosomal protein RSM22 (predicted rRNA methylase)
MTVPANLPPELSQRLETLAQGKSRRDMAGRATALSQRYRAGGGSADVIASAEDALAYAFARMPATYAAVAAVLAALIEAWPDFSPRTVLDVGAGPGTAAWAAAQHLPDIEDIRLIDDNAHLRELALALFAASATPALRAAAYDKGEITRFLRERARVDLVIASYVAGELAPETLPDFADALWSSTGNTLVVIEPGTPAGFLRIRELRAHLITRGAHVVAPCPHDRACPIVAPDWCHFSQRLARSRDHRQIKGAALSFEDEKFSYVVLAHDTPRRAGSRVLAHPRVSKATASAKLCTAEGIVTETAARRDSDRYKALKSWRWGDAVTRPGSNG